MFTCVSTIVGWREHRPLQSSARRKPNETAVSSAGASIVSGEAVLIVTGLVCSILHAEVWAILTEAIASCRWCAYWFELYFDAGLFSPYSRNYELSFWCAIILVHKLFFFKFFFPNSIITHFDFIKRANHSSHAIKEQTTADNKNYSRHAVCVTIYNPQTVQSSLTNQTFF